MKVSQPIVLCDKNEEFRMLLRDILIRNGFFHIVEIQNTDDALDILKTKNNFYIFIHIDHLSLEVCSFLEKKNNFIIFSNEESEKLPEVGARLGVEKIMMPPFHTRKILKKMQAYN